MVRGKNQCGIGDSASFPTGVQRMGPTPPPTPPPPTPARPAFATWGALSAALNQTGASGTFTLSGPSFAMTGYTGGYGITISGSVTIAGAGATMDAGAKGRFFYIPSADDSLTLVDLTLRNGHVNVSVECVGTAGGACVCGCDGASSPS